MNEARAQSAGATRRRVAHLLWMLNILLGVWIATPLLRHAPASGALRAWTFAALGLVSTIVVLSLVPGILSLALASATPWARLRLPLLAVLWAAFQLLLFADVQVFGHFRYHLNGMVWNVLTTPGGDDAVHLARADYLRVGSALAGLIALEIGVAVVFARAEARRLGAHRLPRVLTRAGRLWLYLLLPVIVAEKSLFAYADLVRDRRVTVVARVLPFYQAVTIKKLAEDTFGYHLVERPSVEVGSQGLLLDYPLHQPQIRAEGARPNILMVVLDGWRRDCLSAEVTPGLFELAAGGRNFGNHLAGGNATRFGIFTLLYGLHGNYWDPVYLDKRPPVLIDSLLRAGYHTSVWSGAKMSYPEFRSTAWVQMEERVHDEFPPPEPHQKDACALDGFLAQLDRRAAGEETRPFFAFMLFDGSHQPYSFPDETARFLPYTKSIDYVASNELERKLAKKERHWNAYRNALAHIDSQLERVWLRLREIGELENTIVIVTGDHGEEFLEYGYFGHTSNFAPAQSLVAFLMRGPGVGAGLEQRPTTHVDVSTTLLELLGADGARREGWSLGQNLFEPLEQRARVMSGWETLGLWTDSGIFFLPVHPAFGGVELYDYEWNLVLDDRAAFQQEASNLSRLMLECRRFLR